ncbi:MAG: hypothetical protein EOM77_03555 [Bacteroidia bacterium]|nr:hypothetical protein [Bacteroidia bacterium]
MKQKLVSTLLMGVLVTGVLTGCAIFDPDAKGFSEVFAMTWDTYKINLDENDHPNMNYQAFATMNIDGIAVGTAKALFNNDSFYVEFDTKTSPKEENGDVYNGIRLEGYGDFTGNAFYYHLREYDVAQTWTLTNESWIVVDLEERVVADALASVKDWKAAIETELLPNLTNASVIDYAVGLSSLKNNKYSYSFTVGGYVNWNFVKDLGVEDGISNTVLDLVYDVSNDTAILDFDFAIGTTPNSVKLTLSRPGLVSDADTLLSSEQKSLYSPLES